MLLLLACVAPVTEDFSVTTAGLDTVYVARWTTSEPLASHVVVSFDGEELSFDEQVAATDHEMFLYGVPANTSATVDLVHDDAIVSTTAIVTGGLPGWVPDLNFAADVLGASEPGFTVVPVVPESGGGVIAVDHAGRVVWSYPPEDEGEDLVVRARLSLDGEAILYNTPAETSDSPGLIHRVSLRDATEEEVPVTGGHIDFVEYTQGGYLALGWDIREIDGRKILADTVVERAPDGAERVVWTAWDSFEPDLSVTWPSMYPADPTVEDWTHINGMSYRPDQDAIYLTMTFNSGVAKIDRASGRLDWVVSDQDGDFAMSEPDLVQMPHSAVRLEDGGLLVFNRGDIGHIDEGAAFVVELALDEGSWTAEPRWTYTSPDELIVAFLGSAQRLGNGNTLIAWSSAGEVSEVTPDGEVAWQIGSNIGAAFGFSTRVRQLGP